MQHAKDEWQPKTWRTPPRVFTSAASFYFRREFLTSAASFSFLPWAFLFCRELFSFAVSFSFLPWAFLYCRGTCGPPYVIVFWMSYCSKPFQASKLLLIVVNFNKKQSTNVETNIKNNDSSLKLLLMIKNISCFRFTAKYKALWFDLGVRRYTLSSCNWFVIIVMSLSCYCW